MRDVCDALVALLLAPNCAACGQPLARPTRGCVCEACWRAIVVSPAVPPDDCGAVLCSDDAAGVAAALFGAARDSPAISASRAIGPHDGALRAIIHAFKYDGRRSIAAPLGRLMRSAAADLLPHADAVVPVPLHAARRRARGFNQAADLAHHIGPPVVDALARIRNTPTQTALPAAERLTNVAGAFRATRRARALRHATVLLVDDVRTTGATLDACAQALKAADVTCVIAVTAARVATPGG
jgi:ComF family protein